MRPSSVLPWILVLCAFVLARGAMGWPRGVDRDENQDCWNGRCLAVAGTDQLGRPHPLVLLDYGDDKHALYAYLLAGFEILGIPMRPENARWFSTFLVGLGIALAGAAMALSRSSLSAGLALAAALAATAWIHVGPTLAWECATSIPAYGGMLSGLALALRGRPRIGGICFVLSLVFGVYGYPSPKVLAPALLLAGAFLGFRASRARIAVLVSGGLLCLPLLIDHILHPETIDRAVGISVFRFPLPEALGLFLRNWLGHFSPRFLLFDGDPLARHFGGTLGVLPLGLAFGFLIWILFRLRPSGTAPEEEPRAARGLDRFLLLCLLLFPIPAALTTQQGDGHVLRSLLGSLVFAWFGVLGLRSLRGRLAPLAVLAGLAVTVQGALDLGRLHTTWKDAPETRAAFHETFYGDLRETYLSRKPARVLFSLEAIPGGKGVVASAFPLIPFAWTACDQRPIPGRFQEDFRRIPGVPDQLATEGPCLVGLWKGQPRNSGSDLLLTLGSSTPAGFREILRSGHARFLWREGVGEEPPSGKDGR